MTLVSASGLIKRFGAVTAVNGISLGVAKGEVTGFLGPNGAGKSTTMKMVCGFLEPDAGRAEICGVDIWQHPVEAKRRLGYLPEGAPAYGDMAVADFLAFCGRMRGLSGGKLRNALAEMAEKVRLTEAWSKPIDTLSKGYRRRVGIAQALIHDPEVLVLDEPTDGLDPNQKHEMRNLIREIAPGKAIVISTHILEEVEAICSRAVIIAKGEVVADGSPHELLARAAEGNAIRVTLATPETQAVVERVRRQTDAEIEVLERVNGSTRLLLHYGQRPADAADLAQRLARAGLPVEEVGLWRPRLEDVFRNVTTTLH